MSSLQIGCAAGRFASDRYTRTVVSHNPDDSFGSSVWPSWRIITLTAVVAVWLAVAACQVVFTWRGDSTELLLLIAGNALVTTAGSWLFHLRWLATGSLHDRRIRNAYLPMATYFLLRLAVAPFTVPAVRAGGCRPRGGIRGRRERAA